MKSTTSVEDLEMLDFQCRERIVVKKRKNIKNHKVIKSPHFNQIPLPDVVINIGHLG